VVGLTAAQRERIRTIEDESFWKPGTTNERLLGVLTREQAQRWRELTGPPFKGPMNAFGPPFGPLPGPPR
jgi:hypothetical protein